MSTTVTFDPPAEHHPKLWVSDGNVVLSAVSLDKTRTILFRVHKSMLSDQSEVFASMFTMPQGQENEGNPMEMYEGLPLVRLPDSAEELDALVNALRDTFPLYERSTLSDTPIRVRPALSLASKYLMNDLRVKLIRIVEFQWPHTLDELEKRDLVLEEARKSQEECAEWPLMFLPEPAAAVSLAEEFNIQSILPAAYYDLLRCSASTNWNLAMERRHYNLTPGKKPARWHMLSPFSLQKLLVLRELFEDYERSWSIFTHTRPTCESRADCREVWNSIYKDKETRISTLKIRDPLLAIRETEDRMMNCELCSECYELVARRSNSVKEDIWNKVRAICYPAAQS